MKIVNEIKTKEDFLELYKKCWLEYYEPTMKFRDEISYLTLSGYIELGYKAMTEIAEEMNEIREIALNIKQNNIGRISIKERK